ncbi:hypothetical protein [Streptococcus anginosus]|uniref:Uncharacterized protein n=1 Tax=Streptococcus anginosus subsp. whileyi CCUG 39159 TaxID=1095729 RepID=I0S8X9_STRAP|nr:hypothetical protein [Streptococcus anginosus]EID19832.1 hypothetical protein HMPREF1043_0882 [Streptococcus anginosus subsp. whileyi CCUG 39159]QQT08996.1 hypothetical protein I6J12_11070 [Streptococcus anginosus]
MTKKKIERLSVIHRREINWLKWYFLRDKKNPKKTILEQKIHEAFLENDIEQSVFLVNLKSVTDEYIKISDRKMLKTIKEVYVYESLNVIGACQKILYLSPSSAYSHINRWFDKYFVSTYKHIPLLK